MPTPTFRRFRQVCPLLAITLFAAMTQPAAAERVRLGYAVYAGGFEVLKASLLLDMGRKDAGNENYVVEVDAETEGLIGALVSWSTKARSSGVLRDGEALPRDHRHVGSWRGEDRAVTLDYDGRGGVKGVARPTAEQDDREPVPPEMTPGTVDPLSAVLSVAADVARGRECSETVAVYDGRRRYDLTFRSMGRFELAPSRYSIFSGPTFLCQVSSKILAGNWRKPSRWVTDEDKRRPVSLMLATLVEGFPPFPVRLEGESRIGDVIMHLTSIDRLPGSDTAELASPAQRR